MGLVLEDENGNQGSLDDSFIIKSIEIESEDSISPSALSHGGRDSSPGYFEPRMVTIAGAIYGSTPQEYESKKKIILDFLIQSNLKLYKENPLDRYLVMKRLLNFGEKFQSGLPWRVAEVSFECVCEDPFWQDVNQSTYLFSATTNSTYFTVHNPGTVETYPVLTCVALADNPRAIFKNTTNHNRQSIYTDSFFTQNTTMVIDSQENTVNRDETNAIRYFTGEFPKLLTGSNTFQYFGEDISIEIEYRARYI